MTNTLHGGIGIDTTSTARGHVFVRDNLSVDEDWWEGTTPTPIFTLLAASNYTFEAVVNFNGRSWDGAGTDGLMGQSGGNEFWMRAANGYLEYVFDDGTIRVLLADTSIDIKSAYDGEFHNITVVLDRTAGEIRAYLDGQLVHTNTDAGIPALGDMLDGMADFRLGAYNTTDASAFNGLQHHYRISSFARTPDEFLSLDPLPPLESAVLTIKSNADLLTVGSANLSSVSGAYNTLQFKEALADVNWGNLSTVTGVSETNWLLPTTLGQGFYRIQSSY